jgi:NitT/TauT family transport system permease protein
VDAVLSAPQRPSRRVPPAVVIAVLLVAFAIVWEAAKLIFRLDDRTIPHLSDIVGAYLEPSRRNGPPLGSVLFEAALFTLRGAVLGFLIGAIAGFILGTLFAHLPLLERSLVPFVVASQTIPILAIAPMVVIWLRGSWWSVPVIAAYLTFFPVTINTLRGMRSPDPRAVELLHSYAATLWETLWKLRFPAALPAIFTALKIAATASVVGAIIAELPSGIQQGLGGAILNFNQYYITGPERLWAAIVTAAVVGIAFFVAISLIERMVLRNIVRPS